MTSYAARIDALFDQISTTPWGPEESALVAQAVALAQESGDERREYEARLRQTSSANMNGDTDLMLTSFAWCLAHHDSDPERFPAEIDAAGDVLWQFKWMAGALGGSPEFSAEQIAAVLDDMADHYRRAGVGESGVLMARFDAAWGAGRLDEATELQRQLESAPRDDYSHCDACTRSQFAGFFVETGRDAEAIELVDELIDGGFACGEEPEHALARVLLPSLRAGKLDEARSAHLRSYRLSKDSPDKLAIVAHHIVFCAVTGNEARALALVERHLPWLAHDGLNAHAHQSALASIGIALDAVAAAGHPDLTVRGSDADTLIPFFGPHDGPWAVGDLAGAAHGAADRIAAAFDARDANTAHSERLRRLRETGRERYDVPLGSHDFAATVTAAAPQTQDERYDRAASLSHVGSTAALEAIRAALPEATDTQRVELTSMLLGGLLATDQVAEADAALPSRVAALRAVGRDERADIEERLGLLLFGQGIAEAEPALRAELAQASGAAAEVRADLTATLAIALSYGDDPALVAGAASDAAKLYVEAGEPTAAAGMRLLEVDARARSGQRDAAETLADALVAMSLSDGHRARGLMIRSQLRAMTERFSDAAADADEATRLLLGLGADDVLMGQAFVRAGALHEDAGDPGAAASRFRLGADRLDAAGLPSFQVRYRLGHAMLLAGSAHAATDVLDDVYREETEADELPGSRALTLTLLARAFEAAEEPGAAYGAWTGVADLLEQAEDAAGQAFALVQVGRLLGWFGEWDDAVTPLTEALGLVRGREDQVTLAAEAVHSLAQVRMRSGDLDGALTTIDEALTIGRAAGDAWYLNDVTDTRAHILAEQGRVDEAVASALQAADGFAGLGDVTAAGRAELLAARILTDAERLGDAVPLYRAAIEHAEAGEAEPMRVTAALEFGDVLEKLGRLPEAAEVRATLPA
ncbi:MULTISPECIES: hypothetical protein [unclassified Microbacterium]|uniref:hypothetical protein n=1 Tax=unclassified Microbacterium TaxID=2609290 RepID=UPI00386F136E